MANHWLRGLQVLNGTTGGFTTGVSLRLIYEFWGYCVNGTTALTTPGGMPTTPTNGPANAFEGTTVLATGSDGVTTADSSSFTSAAAPFTSAMVGAHLVVWSPGSGSSEDSVYRITNFVSSTEVIVDVTSGGSPHPSTLNLRLTSRTGLRFRVVDLKTVSTLAWTTGHYVVIQFDGPSVNAGQANGQVQFIIETSTSRVNMYMSRGGTWTGAAFTDSSTVIGAVNWFNSSSTNAINWFTMIADAASLLFLVSGGSITTGLSTGFHFEIPTRIYTLAQDPNPITGMSWALTNPNSTSTTSDYGKGFRMVSQDTTTYQYSCLTRSSRGNGNTSTTADLQKTIGQNMTDPAQGQNRYSGDLLVSPVQLALVGVSGQFQFARCQLRRVLFYANAVGANEDRRLGTTGDWITIRNGIAWPWDNARTGRKLNPGGA